MLIRSGKWLVAGGLVCGGLFLASQAQAQTTGGTATGGSMSGGSTSGRSSSTFGSNTFGSTSGGQGSATGAAGATTFSSSQSLGNTGTTTTNTGGSSAVSSSNLFRSHYANPLAIGLSSATGTTGASTRQTGFGQPLYQNLTGTNTGTGFTGGTGGAQGQFGNRGGLGGTATTLTGNSNAQPFGGASSIGVRRAPAYSTTLGFDYQAPAATSVAAKVQNVFAESSRLPSKANMRIEMDGETYVLKGTVATDKERRLAEALARLTPGVHDLRNELTVK